MRRGKRFWHFNNVKAFFGTDIILQHIRKYILIDAQKLGESEEEGWGGVFN